MKHVKLFEQFNPYDPLEIIHKFRILAEGSGCVRFCTDIEKVGHWYQFFAHTNVNSHFEDNGYKIFKVKVHDTEFHLTKVEFYEGKKGEMKKVLSTDIEIEGENNLDVIIINYLEVTQMYDDTLVQNLVDCFHKIKSVKDIQRLTKYQLPHHLLPDEEKIKPR